ncbi:hypothetical protein CYMTET_11776 [Cymbomonas tetramitiformis]|uniref:Uncharacterized protein n=1 Tax=Cymbomonas tetramitiformis TaxID=36881 RepID=A0AAE0LCI3_9CHLO|nr:hypothetical protein CYMTET_39085 [Cymbomonas tetramitiformis]KAK3280381.1 hypothetical protein CYMTET_11776 [Cymbomonas tetramitiformis]
MVVDHCWWEWLKHTCRASEISLERFPVEVVDTLGRFLAEAAEALAAETLVAEAEAEVLVEAEAVVVEALVAEAEVLAEAEALVVEVLAL